MRRLNCERLPEASFHTSSRPLAASQEPLLGQIGRALRGEPDANVDPASGALAIAMKIMLAAACYGAAIIALFPALRRFLTVRLAARFG